MITKTQQKLFSLSLLLAFSLVFGITSCTAKSKNSTKDTTSEAKASTKKVEEKTYARHITQEQFIDLVADYNKTDSWEFKGKVPVIVDFFATWCGPCKQIAPILEKLAKENDGKLIVYKVDVDDNKDISKALGIRSIPSLLFVPVEGKPSMSVGSLPEADLRKELAKIMK